jgi:N-acetylmuramoyl-L-alanine amidase-like protein
MPLRQRHSPLDSGSFRELIAPSALLRSPAVIRFRAFLGTALALSAIVATFVNAQLTDDEKKKRDARIKAREEMRAVASPTPAETPEPTAKPKPAKRKAKKPPTPKSKSGTKKSGDEDEEATPKPKRTEPVESGETPEPTRKPVARKSPTPEPDESPARKRKAKSGTRKSSEKDKEAKPKPAKRKAKKLPTPKPKPTATPAARKSPTPEPDESPMPKSKAKSGTKKSGEEDEAPAPARPIKKAESGAPPEPTTKHGARKSPTPEPDESPTPKPGAKKETEPKKEATPKRIEKAEPVKTPPPIEKLFKAPPEPTRTPAPEPSVHPRPASTPPLPQAALPPDITVEKSGLEKEQGLEPPPPPPPRRGLWPWSRQPANYRYLTSATIDAIRRAPVQRARWKFIIVHNSGTRQGNARAFDYYHRKIRRMRNGLAYHFVIGNGTSSRNGQIEIGDRWRRQINGGHVHSDYMNNIGLGICLVGDFNRDQPTRAQLEACEELIRYLQERCGKSDGRSLIVRPHREVNPPRWATDCPGDAFPYVWFGRFR